MNIAKAKEQIRNAVDAYLTKDEYGDYAIPLMRQRPVLLIGAPGIGKTAIVEQVAEELGIGLVSYSMTHHTRQSALGLPFIVHRSFEGAEYDASEYTMSEIIASIYELMDGTDVREGILFLDEINCVSETLAPSMLQFLQFKTFGRHRVPDGWVIVCAGNPPEYNKSVHEFDIVTLDRVKRVVVEPDFESWRAYATKTGVHGAVVSFLDAKRECFYRVEKTLSGKDFVTARGWVDVSDMIKLYEAKGIPVDSDLIVQYLQMDDVAEEFALYYELYMRYKTEYGIEGVLAGEVSRSVLERAQAAAFDERLSLLAILLDAVQATMRSCLDRENGIVLLRDFLREFKKRIGEGERAVDVLEELGKRASAELESGLAARSISPERAIGLRYSAERLKSLLSAVNDTALDGLEAFECVQKRYIDEVEQFKALGALGSAQLSNLFAFVEEAFGNGDELTVLVTELTARYHCSRFISKYGSTEYFEHNSDLLVYKRSEDLQERIRALNLDA